ncbi:hypothetical protein F4782DRAFT_74051 [Xylaria castorea]|nr:hypothetical protein F4782DRAFT_74051 [Xylaria castorea]
MHDFAWDESQPTVIHSQGSHLSPNLTLHLLTHAYLYKKEEPTPNIRTLKQNPRSITSNKSPKMPDKTSTLGNSAQVQPDGTTTNVTKKGTIVQSSDPTTHPDASLGQKLKGDFQGALHAVAGSAQTAAGAVTGNEKLKAEGLQKMQDEDRRLGVKHGVMPVGSGLREKASGVPSDVDQTQQSGPAV